MSGRSNAALVREMHDAFGRRDLEAFLGYCADDVRIHSDIGAYPPGHTGIRRWWADVVETFAVGTPRFGLIVELGDVVVALVEASWRGRASSVEFTAGRVQVSRWRDGRVEWWGFYLAVEEAIEGAGLDTAEAQTWDHVLTGLGIIDAFNHGDVQRTLDNFHDEAEVRPALLAAVEGVEVLKGRDEIRRYLENVHTVFDEFEARPYEVRMTSVNSGVILTRTIARGGASGIGIDRETAYVITLRDERVYRQEAFFDVAEALGAAGLSP